MFDDDQDLNFAKSSDEQSPEKKSPIRQTFGLPKLQKKTEDQLCREEYQRRIHEGSLTLKDLQAKPEKSLISPEQTAMQNPRHLTRRRAAFEAAQKAKMLNLGKEILNKSAFSQVPENLSIDFLRENLDDLFQDASDRNIWRSFTYLSRMQQRILNTQYKMGLVFDDDGFLTFLPEEHQLALGTLQRNLVSILAFLHSQGVRQEEPKNNQDSLMRAENFSNTASSSLEKLEQKQEPSIKKPVEKKLANPTSEIRKTDTKNFNRKSEKKTMKKKGGLTRVFGFTVCNKLREIGIHSVSELTTITSDELVSKLKQFSKHPLTVRAIATSLKKHNLCLADGEETTRYLLMYSPKNYAPFEKSSCLEPDKLINQPKDKEFKNDDSSFSDPFRKIADALDMLTSKNCASGISFSGSISDKQGRIYQITINEIVPAPASST